VGIVDTALRELNDQLADFSDDFGFNAESDAQLRTTTTL